MNLIIVESPNKIKTIQEILKNSGNWMVAASVGHIRDLPFDRIGVAPPSFSPEYEIPPDKTENGRRYSKKDVVDKLKQLVKGSDVVYLATDPDREGEAIAWHLQEALGLKNPLRITFNEVTASAVLAAIKSPRKIDMRLVAAQEARRVLDRLVGYTCSRPVSILSGEKASAGRVQTPALRLLVEREEDIRLFKPTNHFGVVMKFNPGWIANWDCTPLLEKGQEYWMDQLFAARVAKLLNLKAIKTDDSEAKVSPPAPFTTLTLQKAASVTLGFKPDVTMSLAQSLFAAGHITYHRTDNPNLTAETVAEVFAYCKSRGWPTASLHRKFPSKAGAQEAHPAITPKHLEIEEVGDNPNERALYKLIRNRAIASQMADALFDTRKVVLESVDALDGKKMIFRASGRVLKFAGWKDLTQKDAAVEDDDVAANPIPKLQEGSIITADKGELQQKKTQPPKRYTEATLLDALEKSGIGRPSTYAAIIANIRTRFYYEEVESGSGKSKVKTIKPTPKGEKVIHASRNKFKFVDYDYTRLMEEDLDKICDGKCDYLTVVKNGYAQLEKELAVMGYDIKAAYAASCADASGVVHKCPTCKKPLRKLTATKGSNIGKPFWGCSNYKKCSQKPFNHNEAGDCPQF